MKIIQIRRCSPLQSQSNSTMQCVCNQPISRLCNTPICSYPSQLCDNKLCSIYQKHLLCSTLLLDQYMAIDKNIERTEKAFAERVNIVINELVEEIKYKENLRLKRRNFEKLGKLIKKLKKDKRNKSNVISGKEVCEMQEEVRQLREEDSNVFFERSLKEFTKKFEEIKQKIIEEKGKYFEKRTDEEHSSEERPLQVEVVLQSEGQLPDPKDPINVEDLARKRGKIQAETTEFLTIKDKIFLKESFPQKEIADIKKIYTASAFQNYYSPQAFYKKCGNLKNTLIVVKYKHKYQSPFDNNYFAAFTPLKLGYQHYQYRSYQDDPEFLSKLFWMNEKIVFPIKKEMENKAIFIDKDYGLCYGNDLLIKFKGQDVNMITIGSKYEAGHLRQEQIDLLSNYQKRLRSEGKVYDYQVYQVEFRE